MYHKISFSISITNFYHQLLVNSSGYLASWKALKPFHHFYLVPTNNKELNSPCIPGPFIIQVAIIFEITYIVITSVNSQIRAHCHFLPYVNHICKHVSCNMRNIQKVNINEIVDVVIVLLLHSQFVSQAKARTTAIEFVTRLCHFQRSSILEIGVALAKNASHFVNTCSKMNIIMYI